MPTTPTVPAAGCVCGQTHDTRLADRLWPDEADEPMDAEVDPDELGPTEAAMVAAWASGIVRAAMIRTPP